MNIRYKILVLVALNLLSSTSYTMLGLKEPEKSKPIIKRGWQEALDGNYEESRKQLCQAADAGNLKAALFLASGYATGTLVTPQDNTQAKTYKEKAERLKEERRQLFIQREKESDFWYTWHLEKLDNKIAQQNNYIQAARYAREHPWYHSVIAILKQEYEAEAAQWYHLRNKKFKTPLPEDGICKLLDMYTQCKLDESHASLVLQSIQYVNNPKIYDHALTLLQKEYKEAPTEHLLKLLFCIHNGALEFGKKEELSKAYSNYLWSMRTELWGTQENNHASILKALSKLNEIDPKEALEILTSLTSKKIERIHFPNNSVLIDYLALMYQLFPDTFENYRKEICANHLHQFLSHVLTNPQKLENTPLSLDKLINLSFEQAQQQSKDLSKPEESFETFITQGAHIHEAYQERIAAFLPTLLQTHPRSSRTLIQLLASPLPNLRRAAFETLTEFFSSIDHQFYVDLNIEYYLNANLNNIIPDLSALALHRIFYSACKKKQSTRGIQYLWQHLAKSTDTATQQFLVQSVYDFFSLESKDNEAHQSFTTALNQALAETCSSTSNNHSRPNIGKFLMMANKTGLIELINPTFLEEQKNRRLLQEETPIKERCQFLNDLLIAQAQKQEQPDFNALSAQIEQLPNSTFKAYAQTVLATLNPQQTLFEYFGNRRRLLEFHQQNNVFASEPEIISGYPHFFNAHAYHLSRPRNEQPKQWVTITNELKATSLHNGLLFGYVWINRESNYRSSKTEYRLYGCNPDDGYAVWGAPIQFKKQRPYCVTPQSIYCATDEATILILNTNDGSVKGTIQHPLLENIEDLHTTTDNTLVALKEKEVCFINVAQGALKTYSLPKTTNYFQFCGLSGDICICKNYQDNQETDLLLVDTTGNAKTIKTGAKGDFGLRHVTATPNRLYYVAKINNNRMLVARDVETTNVVWTLALPEDLEEKPQLSHDGSKLFALTRYELIALDTNPSIDESKRILWRVSNKSDSMCENITKILVDDASQTVYGINGNLPNPLRTYNMQTGAESIYDEVEDGRSRSILGIHNGKLYLQSYHF